MVLACARTAASRHKRSLTEANPNLGTERPELFAPTSLDIARTTSRLSSPSLKIDLLSDTDRGMLMGGACSGLWLVTEERLAWRCTPSLVDGTNYPYDGAITGELVRRQVASASENPFRNTGRAR